MPLESTVVSRQDPDLGETGHEHQPREHYRESSRAQMVPTKTQDGDASRTHHAGDDTQPDSSGALSSIASEDVRLIAELKAAEYNDREKEPVDCSRQSSRLLARLSPCENAHAESAFVWAKADSPLMDLVGNSKWTKYSSDPPNQMAHQHSEFSATFDDSAVADQSPESQTRDHAASNSHFFRGQCNPDHCRSADIDALSRTALASGPSVALALPTWARSHDSILDDERGTPPRHDAVMIVNMPNADGSNILDQSHNPITRERLQTIRPTDEQSEPIDLTREVSLPGSHFQDVTDTAQTMVKDSTSRQHALPRCEVNALEMLKAMSSRSSASCSDHPAPPAGDLQISEDRHGISHAPATLHVRENCPAQQQHVSDTVHPSPPDQHPVQSDFASGHPLFSDVSELWQMVQYKFAMNAQDIIARYTNERENLKADLQLQLESKQAMESELNIVSEQRDDLLQVKREHQLKIKSMQDEGQKLKAFLTGLGSDSDSLRQHMNKLQSRHDRLLKQTEENRATHESLIKELSKRMEKSSDLRNEALEVSRTLQLALSNAELRCRYLEQSLNDNVGSLALERDRRAQLEKQLLEAANVKDNFLHQQQSYTDVIHSKLDSMQANFDHLKEHQSGDELVERCIIPIEQLALKASATHKNITSLQQCIQLIPREMSLKLEEERRSISETTESLDRVIKEALHSFRQELELLVHDRQPPLKDQEAFTGIQVKLDASNIQTSNLKNALLESKAKVEVLTEQNGHLRNQLSVLQENQPSGQGIEEELREMKAAMTTTNDAMQAMLTGINENVAVSILDPHIRELKAQIDPSNKQVSEVDNAAGLRTAEQDMETEHQNAEHSRRENELLDRLAALNEELNSISIRDSCIRDTANKQLTEKNIRLEAELSRTQTQLHNLQVELKERQAALANINAETEILQATTGSHVTKVQDLGNRQDHHQADNEVNQSSKMELLSLTQKLGLVEKELSSVSLERLKLQGLCVKLRSEAQNVQRDNEVSTISLKQQLNDTQTALKRAEDDQKSTQRALESLEAEHAEWLRKSDAAGQIRGQEQNVGMTEPFVCVQDTQQQQRDTVVTASGGLSKSSNSESCNPTAQLQPMSRVIDWKSQVVAVPSQRNRPRKPRYRQSSGVYDRPLPIADPFNSASRHMLGRNSTLDTEYEGFSKKASSLEVVLGLKPILLEQVQSSYRNVKSTYQDPQYVNNRAKSPQPVDSVPDTQNLRTSTDPDQSAADRATGVKSSLQLFGLEAESPKDHSDETSGLSSIISCHSLSSLPQSQPRKSALGRNAHSANSSSKRRSMSIKSFEQENVDPRKPEVNHAHNVLAKGHLGVKELRNDDRDTLALAPFSNKLYHVIPNDQYSTSQRKSEGKVKSSTTDPRLIGRLALPQPEPSRKRKLRHSISQQYRPVRKMQRKRDPPLPDPPRESNIPKPTLDGIGASRSSNQRSTKSAKPSSTTARVTRSRKKDLALMGARFEAEME